MKTLKTILRLGLSAGALLVSGTANAQSTAEQGGPVAQSDAPTTPQREGLEEIVVTARRVVENLQSVPVAVTAFTGARLEEQNVRSVRDVALFTPNLRTSVNGSDSSVIRFQIRGQLQSDTIGTQDPSVGTYVDGIYWARPVGLATDLLDVERVEVLKGPQGTLFGRNSPAGAVNITTADPKLDEVSGLISGTYGNYNQHIERIIANVPLSSTIGLRVAFQKSDRDGFVTELNTGKKLYDEDLYVGRVKLLFKPSNTFSLLLSGEFFGSNNHGLPNRLVFYLPDATRDFLAPGSAAQLASAVNLPNDQVSFNRLTSSVAKTRTVSATATLDTSIGVLKAIGGYRYTNSYSDLDVDGSPASLSETRNGTLGYDQWSGEFQLASSGKRTLDYTAGLYAFKESGTDLQDVRAFPPPGLNPFSTVTYRSNTENKSIGIYGQGTVHATNTFSITAGLRYTHDTKRITSFNNSSNPRTGLGRCDLPTALLDSPGVCAATFSKGYNGLSYLFSLNYKPNDDLLVYVKTSRGYRSGGQNFRGTTAAVTFTPFGPEKATDYEIGLKSEFLNNRVRFNAAAFYTDYRDFQRSANIVDPVSGQVTSIVRSAGKARIAGGEVEIDAAVIPEVRISLGLGISDPKYLDYTGLDATGHPVDLSNERFQYVPKYTGNASVAWRHPTDFGALLARADLSFQSKMALATSSDPAYLNATTAKTVAILNARIGATVLNDKLDVAVFGSNLTNRQDLISALQLGAPIALVNGITRPPRQYGISAAYKF